MIRDVAECGLLAAGLLTVLLFFLRGARVAPHEPTKESEATYEGRTLAEWEQLRDKAIRLNDLFCELVCKAHIRLMHQGRRDGPEVK